MATTNDMDRYAWERVWRDSQTNEAGKFCGLSVFLDCVSGRFAVRDMSGPLPHLTDDGVLWLDDTRPITITMSGRWSALVPVVSEAGATSHVLSDARDVASLLDRLREPASAFYMDLGGSPPVRVPRFRVQFTQDAAEGVKVLTTLLYHAACCQGRDF